MTPSTPSTLFAFRAATCSIAPPATRSEAVRLLRVLLKDASISIEAQELAAQVRKHFSL